MSTTRTNDNALTKKQLEKQQKALEKEQKKLEKQQQALEKKKLAEEKKKEKELKQALKAANAEAATEMVKAFLKSKYSNRTELIYLFVNWHPESDEVDCKIGMTSFRAAIVSRSGDGYVYRNKYTFFKQFNKQTGKAIERKRYAPIDDKELRILKRDFQKRLDDPNQGSIKTGGTSVDNVEDALKYYVSNPHEEFKTLFLSTSRFGDAQYIHYPVLLGWWAFPYEKVDGVLHDESYWETEVEKVLQPFRVEHRLTMVPRNIRYRDGTEKVVMVAVQNTASDGTENALFRPDVYRQYQDRYMETCERLGGIWIPFTESFIRCQTSTAVRKDSKCSNEFAVEMTKCHWEGIKAQLKMEGIEC